LAALIREKTIPQAKPGQINLVIGIAEPNKSLKIERLPTAGNVWGVRDMFADKGRTDRG
jgi:hypothetical protein